MLSRWLLLLMISMVLLACDADGETVGEGDFSVTIYNRMDTSLCAIYLVPSNAPDDATQATPRAWGDDYLGSTGVLDNRSTFTIRVDAGRYALRADRCNGDPVNNAPIDITEDYTWTLR